MLSRTAALLALVALTTLLAANSANAQQLKMPSDPLAGTVIESDVPSPSAVQLTPGGANVVPSGGDISMSNGSMSNGAPSSMYSSGAAYNPTLGAHIRATYTTQSYGQEAGQLSLGTMKLFQGTDGMSFIDGQVTMNDESNIGYNLGIGYRWMTLPIFPFSPDAQKIAGVSLWSDGLSKGDGTFFPQIGGSLELLGEHLDLRANGYLPLGEETQTRDFFQTGVLTYSGNNLATQLQGVADTSLTVGEIELAGRIANYDAWVFGGGYGFNGGEFDGGGGKVGLRGYATPDLMVSVAIANDNEFDTNTLVNLTWFIGRTRAENCPRGELSDRFREPVIRNNYVALQQSTVFATGGPLLDENGNPFRVFHADSTAGPNGDGTFQNPANSLNDLTNSQAGDIVLAHGGSVFTGQSAALKDFQSFVGEGGGVNSNGSPVNGFVLTQFGGRNFLLPETAPGAYAGARPVIGNNTTTDSVVLADNNTVYNFDFNGGRHAIMSSSNGSYNATISELKITGAGDATHGAINLVAVAGADEYDVDNDSNTTEIVNLLGTVVIDDVDFSGSGGNDIAVTGGSALAGTKIAEVINITDVTSTGSTAAPSIAISNTVSVTGSTTNITNYTYNGTTPGGVITGNGGILLTNTGSATTVTGSDFNGGNGPAVAVNGTTGTVTVDGTTTIDNVTGRAVSIVGNTVPVNIGATITTANTINGGGVFVQGNEGIVSFTGAITANGVNAAELNDTKANVTFGTAADITHTGAGDAMVITNAGSNTTNTAQVTVNGDITNTGGRSVVIDRGDGAITFNGIIKDGIETNSVLDPGMGISITNRENVGTALILFNGQTTLMTGANDALTLTSNGADSVTSFSNLDIATTGAGRGIVALNGGTLNMNTTGATNTISTQTGLAIDITGGSSGTGLVFQTVNVNGATQAIDLNDFSGTVTVNGGTMTTTGVTIDAQNASLVLDEVILDSTFANDVISATVTGNTNRTITITDIDANGDDFNFTTNAGATGTLTATVNNDESAAGAPGQVGQVSFTAAGTGTSSLTLDTVRSDSTFDYATNGTGALNVTMDTIEGGQVTFDSNGAGNSTMSIVDSTTTAGVDLDVDGAGNLTTTMTTVTGAGPMTLDVTSSGDGQLTMTGVNTGSTLTAQSSNTSTGDLVVSATNSGNTTQFTGLTFNQRGSGLGQATFNNVRSSSGIDFDSASDTLSSLTVTGGNYGGNITFDETGDGPGTATLSNVTTTGGVTFNEAGVGAGTLTMTGGTYGAGIDFNEAGAGAGSATLTNVTAAGGVDFDVANQGGGALLVSGGSYEGAITADAAAGGVGNFTARVTDGTTFTAGVPQILFNGQNTGTVTYEISGLAFNTGANVPAMGLTLGANVTTADVTVSGNSDIRTLDSSVLSLDIGGGTVDFLMSGNSFRNNSATIQTVVVNQNGGTLNATLTGNTLTNDNAGGDVLLMQNASSGTTTNLAATVNGASGADYFFVNNSADPNAFNVRGTDATAVDNANPGDVTFTGTFNFDNTLVVPTP